MNALPSMLMKLIWAGHRQETISTFFLGKNVATGSSVGDRSVAWQGWKDGLTEGPFQATDNDGADGGGGRGALGSRGQGLTTQGQQTELKLWGGSVQK